MSNQKILLSGNQPLALSDLCYLKHSMPEGGGADSTPLFISVVA